MSALEGRIELLFDTDPNPDVAVWDMPNPLAIVLPNPCTSMLSS